MPPVRSKLWNMFVKTSSGGKCKLCQCEVKTSGNTTNLIKHLQRRHPKFINVNAKQKHKEQSGSSDAVDDPLNKNKSVNDSSLDAVELLNITDLQSVASTSTASLEPSFIVESRDKESVQSTSSGRSDENTKFCSRSRQPSIAESFSTIKSFSDGGTKAGKVTNAITFMIAKDNLPLNTTEKEGFKYLMKTVAPLYQIPSRTKMASLVDDKFDLLSGMFKQKLENVFSITLTTDVWTETMTTKSFLGVTGHFLLEEKLTSLTIGVFELDQRHNAEYLGQCLSSICDEWNIPSSKITAVVTDNGANIVKAVSDMFGKNKHLPCFAHTLDLVASKITDNTDNLKIIIDKVKSIVTYFKQSVAAADELRRTQPTDNILKFVQSVPTRWNSTFYMLERFTKLYEYVAPILIKNPKSPAMVDASELQLIREILTVLSPIEAVSREMCGEKYLTSSKVIPIVNCLVKKMESLSPSTEEVIALKTATLIEISKRFKAIEQHKLLAVSTILDPRFKRLHFNSPSYCANAVTFINQSIQSRKQQNIDNRAESQPISIRDPNSVWTYHDELAFKYSETQDNKGDLDLDFKIYLNSPTMSLASDPFSYWNANSSAILKELATKYLSVVGTSVPSERLFSRAGSIITQTRNRLTGERLTKLLFLNSLNVEQWNL